MTAADDARGVFDVEDVGGVRWLTINRPASRNALTLEQRNAMVALLAEADNEPGVRAVVLTGTDPAFCAGVDLKERNPLTPQDRRFRVNPGKALRAMQTPTIAAVNGSCRTGGLEIALSCHFAIASDEANFADLHARLGILPGWGLSALLPRAVGLRQARQLSITGQVVDATEAVRLGIVNEVVPHHQLRARAAQIAGAIAESDPDAVRDLLALYARGDGASLTEALAFEEDALANRQNSAARDARHRVLKPSDTDPD